MHERCWACQPVQHRPTRLYGICPSTCCSPVGTFQLTSYKCTQCYPGRYQDVPGAPGEAQPHESVNKRQNIALCCVHSSVPLPLHACAGPEASNLLRSSCTAEACCPPRLPSLLQACRQRSGASRASLDPTATPGVSRLVAFLHAWHRGACMHGIVQPHLLTHLPCPCLPNCSLHLVHPVPGWHVRKRCRHDHMHRLPSRDGGPDPRGHYLQPLPRWQALCERHNLRALPSGHFWPGWNDLPALPEGHVSEQHR